MTTQEAYEMMRIYLTRPGAMQAKGENSCMYETYIGAELHRCAVGCLLSPVALGQTIDAPDAYVDEAVLVLRDFNGSLSSLYEVGFELKELAEVDHGFLEGAQVLHDEDDNWIGGVFNVVKLDALAYRNGLMVVVDDRQGVPLEAVAV